MKKLFTLMVIMAMTISVFAQSPQKMSYQCVVRNASGALVTNQVVGIKISILQGSASGTAVYTETLTPTTNANGLVSIEIGGGTGFDLINWSAGPYFLKTETDPAGGTNYTITGTSQLLSAPYALFAKTAETATDAVKIYDDQTIAGNKTFTGTTTVTRPVNATDATTKAYVDEFIEAILNELLDAGFNGIVKDIEGNTYKTTKISDQVWITENLKTTKLNDGTDIPNVALNTEWTYLTTPGYCWYNNDAATYKDVYGTLYNWFTVNTGKLCPTGWHVPTDTEWYTLITNLGGSEFAGGRLKETGTTHWASPNTGATNESGFTALPGGRRNEYGSFSNIGQFGYFWSSTQDGSSGAWFIYVHYKGDDVQRTSLGKESGFSVRCLKDY
jgi:uncharacterized protein (TIGR02145 family)